MRKTLIVFLLIIAASTGAYVSYQYQTPTKSPSKYADANIGGDFVLTSADGPVSLAEMRGKVVVLFFGFTSCPDICPTSLAIMRQALDKLSANDLKRVTGLFISVDPERDSLEHLKAYTSFFSDSIIGATGTQLQIDEVVKQYGAYYSLVPLADSALGYTVDHSTRIYVIGTDGKLADLLPHDGDPEELASKIKQLL